MAQERKDWLKLPKQEQRGDLPSTKEGWVEYINKLHDQGLVRREPYEFQWTLNLAFYLGYQNIHYNYFTRGLELRNDDDRPPVVVNRLSSFIDSRHAKLTKQLPYPQVVANTSSVEDRRAAKYSGETLKNLWRVINMHEEYDQTIFMMTLYGNSFMETLWDPYTGETIKVDRIEKRGEENVLVFDDEDNSQEDLFLGEVCTYGLSPFAIIPSNEFIPSIKEQDWLIKRCHMSKSKIIQIWPHMKQKLEDKYEKENKTIHEQMVQKLASPFYSITRQMRMPMDSVNSEFLVKTFWMKPNTQYPDGLVAVVICDELAMIGSFPNNYGSRNVYPIVKFSEKKNGIHFWCPSTTERLIPIQREFNRLRLHEIDSAAKMGKPKWLLAKGSGVSEDSINDEEGEVIEYNPSVPEPHPAQLSGLPAYVERLADNLIMDFRDVGGQRESSTPVPPSVTASVAMQMYAELVDEIVGPIIRRVATGLELVSEQQLILMNEEYEEDRKVKILGENNSVAVYFLNKMDLRNHTDVHIEVEQMYPEFRGAQQQRIMDLWDRRIETDPNKLKRALASGKIELLLEEDSKVEEAIYLDIEAMKKGKQPEVLPFQNQLAYVRMLSDFIQSPEFLRLIPERKKLFFENIQIRLELLQGQMPNQGQPMGQTNQAAVNTPFGSQKPVGMQ